MRARAGYGTVPGGVGPNNTDNINYYPTGLLSGQIDPSQYAQPHCLPTDITP
jgi:hypothetical protein